jgi:tripartite-type tricarboxylate transporter receptor subunit TctC
MQLVQCLVLAMLSLTCSFAQAQPTYPTKPVRLLVASTPSGQPDTVARIIAQKLSEAWGQPVVIDNRAGAAGSLAAYAVARANPDGHTLLYAPPNLAINAATMPQLPYDTFKDLVPVAHVGISTNVLAASPSLGVKSVKELIAIARAQPDKLILASSTPGSAGYLSGARFNRIAGISALQVPYKGAAEATIEVVAGRSHYLLTTMGSALPFVRDRKLVPLAVTSPQRASALPDVPALGELMPEFARPETSHGILAPAGTARALVARITAEVVRVLHLPDVNERLAAISYVVAPSSPEEYRRILRAQVDALRKIARETGTAQ